MPAAAPIFVTDRTTVRWLNESDLDAMLQVYGDPEAMRWVGDGKPITREECDLWLEVTKRNYETRGYGMSVIDSLETGRAIGFIGLVHPDGQVLPEVKYAFAREHWGKGLATEVVSGMLDYGRRQHAMSEIIATVHQDNAASLRVLEKCGLRRAGLEGTTVVLSTQASI